jgi:hypothetical protein
MMSLKPWLRGLFIVVCHGTLEPSNPLVIGTALRGSSWPACAFPEGEGISRSDDLAIVHCAVFPGDKQSTAVVRFRPSLAGAGRSSGSSPSMSKGRSSAASFGTMAGLGLGVLSGDALAGVGGNRLLLCGDEP